MNSNLQMISNVVNTYSDGNAYINKRHITVGQNAIDLFKKGNKIHIKKANRGKFTKSAKRAGMGVLEYASHVLANKDKYSSTLVKRANFARNASKWKK